MDAVLERLRAELAGRYEVEQELGHGGMAVVYLAKDLRHDRRVAIKVLRQDVGGASAERFLREIRTVAALHHPHILQLLDSGTAGDHLFYVMPYVEGETIRQRLEREGPLPVDEAVRIAREVADALGFAHARGIVHRDIKPENVFLSAGHALVADFGIARAAESAAGSTTLTDAGLAVGTPSYMSPEQATAEPRIDGRSDQYALGCVLYEMLAGAPPFTGPTSQAIMARHTTDPVPPLRTVRDVPVALESAITKALAKMPADRWSSASAFADAISSTTRPAAPLSADWGRASRFVPGAAVVIALALGTLVWQRWLVADASSAAEPPIRSVAVFPITAIGDTNLQRWADGFTEAVINGLVRIDGLKVPQGGRGLQQREPVDPRELGREMGVEAVMTGTLQEAGGRLRLILQLVSVRDRNVRSTRQYDGDAAGIFEMQDSVTTGLATSLRLQLSPQARASLVRGVRTKDSVAYDLYLQARRLTYSFSNDGARRAIALLRQAIARDSTFADAWVAIADAGDMGGMRDLPPAEQSIAKRFAIERAIELDSLNGLAFALRGYGRVMYEWNWDGARTDMQHAVRLSPSSPIVLEIAAVYYNAANQPDSALALMRRAVEMDPTDPYLLGDLGRRYAFAGMKDSALAVTERALAIDSTRAGATWVLTNGFLDAGRREEAERYVARMLRETPDDPEAVTFAALYYRRAGEAAASQRVLQKALANYHRMPSTASPLGVARLGVGDRAGALDALEEAARNREPSLVYDMMFAYTPLIGNERFEKVRRQVFGERPLPRNPYP